MEILPLYGDSGLREVTGQTIRPGGFTLTGRAVEFCDMPEGAVILDAGCGLGATVNWLRASFGFRAVGVDVSPTLLREGRSISPSAPLMAGHTDRLPFVDKCFDAVFCECVLSLLDHPDRALAELERVLKPGGRLIITDIYARRSEGTSYLKDLPLNSCLRGARARHEIARLIKDARFEPVLWEDHSHLLKQLAARLVFEYGSMREFWSAFMPQCEEVELVSSIELARPGYCLLVANKGG